MTININCMDYDETFYLTKTMIESCNIFDLFCVFDIKVDKYSISEVRDKTALIVASIVASCNVNVSKLSGRGLGYMYGTFIINYEESILFAKTMVEISKKYNKQTIAF